MTTEIEKSCATCKHWHGGFTCDAYPQGIPLPIMSGDVAHIKPLPDDNGIQYELNEEMIARIRRST